MDSELAKKFHALATRPEALEHLDQIEVTVYRPESEESGICLLFLECKICNAMVPVQDTATSAIFLQSLMHVVAMEAMAMNISKGAENLLKETTSG